MRKNYLIIAISIVLIALAILYLLPTDTGFSESPEDWITIKGNQVTIDVIEASKAQAQPEPGRLNWYVDNQHTVFDYEGYYHGIYFKREFIHQNSGISISHNLNPRDNIIEGYIFERKIENKLEVIIFLDEDWKRQIPNTNINYGLAYTKTKPFEFTEIKPGIYMDIIEDDAARFSNNYKTSHTGVIVGDITQEQIFKGEIAGKTFMLFQ